MNFALMYLLAKTPPSASSAARGNLIQKLFDENTLKRLGAPGETATYILLLPFCVRFRDSCHLTLRLTPLPDLNDGKYTFSTFSVTSIRTDLIRTSEYK